MTSKPLCRLCIEEVESMFDIFGDFGREQQIQQLIVDHFALEIKEDDPLSDKMCTSCWSKLIEFHSFYCQIQKAQERITMIVIDEIKSEDMEFGDYTENKMLLAAAGDIADTEITEDSELETQAVDNIDTANFKDRNISRTKSFTKTSWHGGDETIVQIQLMPQLKKISELSISSQIDESSQQSINELQVETSLQLPELDEPLRSPEYYSVKEKHAADTMHDSTTCSHASNACSKKMVKKHKPSKKRIGGRDINRHLTRRKYISGRLAERQEESKLGNEEQQQRELELIEAYYRIECDLCLIPFEKLQHLFEHYHEDHKLRGYIVCCGKKFYKRPVIAEHVSWHTQPEMFTCTTCGVIADNKRSFDNHMLTHAAPDAELYQCEHCAKRFTKRFKLEKHKLSHLKDEEKEYICDECDKPYASNALLRSHKRVVHQQTYAHMCEICAKVFKSRTFFEKHQLEHLGKNLPKVQCQICDAWLKNEHSMRAHMRNHQDEGQEHECDICGKKGPSRNAIAKHKRFVHLSERKFKCTLCDKAFKRAITLREHMTVHTGEVLYTCTFCPKTFNSSANMHAHRKKVHPTEWLEDKQSKLESMKPDEERE